MTAIFELWVASTPGWPVVLNAGDAKLLVLSNRAFVAGRIGAGMRVRVATRRILRTNNYLALAFQRVEDNAVFDFALLEQAAGVAIGLLGLVWFTWVSPVQSAVLPAVAGGLLVWSGILFALTISACKALRAANRPCRSRATKENLS